MPRKVAMALAAIVVLVPTLRAEAAPQLEEYERRGVKVSDSDAAQAPTPPAGQQPHRAAAAPRTALPRSFYWDLEWLPNDQFCLRRRSTTNKAVADGAADARWYRSFATANGGTYTECPATAPPERRPRPDTADDAARQFWDVRILPDPGLKVVPDYAITGKTMFLQITGPAQQRFQVDNPLGDDVTVTATSRYVVAWGDGTTTTTSSQGGPWPDGDVTHTYTDVTPGALITVTQVWSAHWTAGSDAGDLADLRTAGTLTLPVTQLQAVTNY